ncbi:para-nitrobenzyl esterase [Promicromonospora sp. AC04]|uniref:carboxylesterase/lipase family protein n=1 Tax=Promicromonospora sp. AC04 TaxID=2135723 RepID=UPI000D33B964|nr:carboxylesterase family protein [Promicromonospora sp. AC04]PUB32305.1 para-nitrobenzyl esterase [Promicromonospora sp. AC04]
MSFSTRRRIVIAVMAVATTAATLLSTTYVQDRQIERGDQDRPGFTIVSTSDGALRGSVERDRREFLGVPYAAPPGRWERPTEVEPWRGVRDATVPGAECVQQAVFWRPGHAASTTEDCLFLDVYTPRDITKDAPVVVFFHGGGSINGSSQDAVPARMAARGDAVVVSASYRLGLMGGLYLPELDNESPDGESGGNYGNLDKIQALRWVQDNAAAFGGDADNVTIAGQSAGAGAVCFLLASPSAEGLFDRAVIESSGSCGSTVSAEAAAARGARVAEHLGCTDESERLACLRAKPAEDVLAAQVDLGVGSSTVPGGADLPLAPADAFAAGDFNEVPVIYGTTRNEDRAFVYEQNDLVAQPLPASRYEATVRAEHGDAAEALLTAYPLGDFDTPGLALAQLGTDERVCTGQPVLDALATHVPTYAYEFQDETAPGRPYMTVPSSFPIGTGHSSELAYLWGSATGEPLDPVQLRLSALMIDYWTQFARSGDPNDRGVPTWPTADDGERLALQSGGRTEVMTGSDFRARHRCDVWESIA